MNFKKFISGVSAFAIAASAFAGMAVTANADTTLKTIDNDTTSISATHTGNNTNFDTTDSSGTFAPALYAAGANKVLRIQGTASGSKKYLGYQAALNTEEDSTATKYTGSIVLSFKIEPMQVRSDKDATITVQFADSDLKGIFPITVGTGKDAYLTVNGAKTTTAYSNYYVVTETLDFDAGTGTVAIDDSDGTNLYKSVAVSLTAKDLSYIYLADKDWQYGACALDDITIVKSEAEATTAKYTVNYQTADGTVIKSTESVGNIGDAPVADTNDFTVEGDKYIVTGSDAETKTIVKGGTTVVTVTVRKAAKYAVKAVASTDSTVVFADATVNEGDKFSYAYPKYLTNASGKVVATSNSATYKATQTVSEAKDYEVAYTAYTGTAQAVEFEKVSTGAKGSNGNPSNGQYARANTAGTELLTVAEAGMYTITIAGCSENTNKKDETVFAIYTNSVEDANSVMSGNFTSSYNYIHSTNTHNQANVKLAVGDKLILTGSANYTNVDYVSIVKTADYSFTFTDTDTVVYKNSGDTVYLPMPADSNYSGWLIDGVYYAGDTNYTITHDVSADVANPPTATAAQYGEDIPADEGYEGTDTVASVFQAEVKAGSYAITNVQFTLNNGAMTTDTWSGNITSGPVVFGLIVPMAGADVNNIKAVLNGASYDAYVK